MSGTREEKELTPEEKANQAARKKQELVDSDTALTEFCKSVSRRAVEASYFESKFTGPAVNPNSDPLTPSHGTFSNMAPEQMLLKFGLYTKISKETFKDPSMRIEIWFGYDSEKKQFTAAVGLKNEDGTKFEPKSESDWNKHAELTGKNAVKFLSIAGFSRITMVFPKDQRFLTDVGGNVGSGTLRYNQICVDATLHQALKEGVGFNDQDPSFQTFRTQVGEKRGDKALAELDALIAKVNRNGKQHKMVDALGHTQSLHTLQKSLDEADKLPAKWEKDIKNNIDAAIEKQEKKVNDLKAEETALAGDPKLPQKQSELAVQQERLTDLKAEKVNITKNIDDAIISQKTKVDALGDEVKKLEIGVVAAVGMSNEPLIKEALAEKRNEFSKAKGRLDDLEAQKTKMPDIDTKIAAQQDKVKVLKNEIAAVPPPADLKQKQDELDAAQKSLADLKKDKAHLEIAVSGVANKEDLEKLKDRLNEKQNPDKKLIGAVKELQNALAKITDKSAYKAAAGENSLDGFENELTKLDGELKKDLNTTDRGNKVKEIGQLIKDMNTFAKAKPDFNKACKAAIDKAEKMVAGKGGLAEVKRIENRVENLEKAAAALQGMLEKQEKFDSAELAPKSNDDPESGMMVKEQGKQRRRIESEKDAKQYVKDRLDEIKEPVENLQKALTAEKKELDKVAGNLTGEDKNKIKEKLEKVEEQLKTIKQVKAELGKAYKI